MGFSREVDNRGLACPEPVVNTKRVLEQMEGEEGSLVAIVDNDGAKENILRLVERMGNRSARVEKKEDGFYITIEKSIKENTGVTEKTGDCRCEESKGPLFLITADTLGRGREELGKILMRSFIMALMEGPVYPEKILFLNSGVNLAIKGSPVVEELVQLESLGVEIFSCGTCLDYYQVKDYLAVGKVTNMYDTVESLLQNPRCVTI